LKYGQRPSVFSKNLQAGSDSADGTVIGRYFKGQSKKKLSPKAQPVYKSC